jgi:transcriptional regulator with XRE-family HTH domain
MSAGADAARQALSRLRRRREELGHSQAKVAEVAGVNPSYVGLLERGERMPSLDVLCELGRAVGLSLPELFAASSKDTGASAEAAAIGAVIARWPAEHRRAAVRVVNEMDALLRAASTASRRKKK